MMAFCIAAGLLAVSCLWSLIASVRGRVAADIDIRRGRYQLLGYGLPSPTRPEYVRCLRERYGIQFHRRRLHRLRVTRVVCERL